MEAADANLSLILFVAHTPRCITPTRNLIQVADFGLSKRIELARGHASMSTVCNNNPCWLAPEVLSGDQAGPPSDVFSFGVVMWELLTWDSPWSKEMNPWTVVEKIKRGERLPVPEHDQLPGPDNDCFGEHLDDYIDVVNQCWSQTPTDRPSFKAIVSKLKSLKEKIVEPQAKTESEANDVAQVKECARRSEMGTESYRKRQSMELRAMSERRRWDASADRMCRMPIRSSDSHLKDLELGDFGNIASDEEDTEMDI